MRIEIPYHPSSRQRAFHETDADEVLYGGAAGCGKALTLNTRIPTPDGWVTMGDIQPGDTVFDENGKPCKVLSVSKVMYGHTVYAVTVSDGSVIEADADHLWVTETYADRTAQHKRSDEYRKQRRAKRPSRGTGKRPDLAERNRTQGYEYKPLPTPTVKTTQEIVDTLHIGTRLNHSIPVCEPLNLPEKNLIIPPYVLGAWLGDGTATAGEIAGIDNEIFDAIREYGYAVTDHADGYSKGILRLVPQLKKIGVYGNKHIPQEYLRASIQQRQELLMGLMDTDGHCSNEGYCEFYNTNQRLIDGVYELLCSLGVKTAIKTGRATLYGKDCGEKYRIKFQCNFPAFRLMRKLERQKVTGFRGTSDRRYIVSAHKIETVPVKCMMVDSESHMFLAGESFIATHNSLADDMDALIRACKYPGTHHYCLRRTYRELEDTLITEMRNWYPKELGTYNEGDKTFTLVNGSQVIFRHCQYEKDVKTFDGAEMTTLYVDEVTHFTKSMIDYLGTRVRVKKSIGVKPQKKYSTNPGGVGHAWVKQKFIDPLPADEIVEKTEWSDYLKKEVTTRIQFIPAFLNDNKHIGDEYAIELEKKPKKLRDALLYGRWNTFEGQAFTEWTDDPKHYDDCRYTHVINPFEIPDHWKLFRAYDYGYAEPFGMLWFAEGDSTVDNRLFLIAEDYGCAENDANTGLRLTATEQARRFRSKENTPYVERFINTKGERCEVEVDMSRHAERNPRTNALRIDGIADPSIYNKSAGLNNSIAEMMAAEGITFRDANFDPEAKTNVVNNRLQGKQLFHEILRFDERGYPGLQVWSCCRNFIKQIPMLVIDPENPEDIVTKHVEDHLYDPGRYTVMIKRKHTKDKKTPQKPTYRQLPADPLDIMPPLPITRD